MAHSAGQHALSTRRGQLGGWSADECRNLCTHKCTENRTKNTTANKARLPRGSLQPYVLLQKTRRPVNILQSHSGTRFNGQEKALKMHQEYIERGKRLFFCRLIWFRPPSY
jgi:hypothetical protein